jgi:hypothetical protein
MWGGRKRRVQPLPCGWRNRILSASLSLRANVGCLRGTHCQPEGCRFEYRLRTQKTNVGNSQFSGSNGPHTESAASGGTNGDCRADRRQGKTGSKIQEVCRYPFRSFKPTHATAVMSRTTPEGSGTALKPVTSPISASIRVPLPPNHARDVTVPVSSES